MKIEDTKKFLIAINAIISQTNDDDDTIGGAELNGTTAKDAIVPENFSVAGDSSKNTGDFSSSYVIE